MGNRTINPIIMVGTYIGLVAGFLLATKGSYIFWWLPSLIGINEGAPMALNMVGGAIAGYIIQILWQVGNFHIEKSSSSNKPKELKHLK
jgi:hypothetical protein